MKMPEEVVMKNGALVETNFQNFGQMRRGKVRDIYDEDGKHLLIIATDRLSAFDVVLPDPIPLKGKVLNQLSAFWFNFTLFTIPNHLLLTEVDKFPAIFRSARDILKGRSMMVLRARALPVECVVRGYVSGSAWTSYQENGTICGISLPKGLRESDKLAQPIFTPSAKVETGHDENINMAAMINIVGRRADLKMQDAKILAERIKQVSLNIFKAASKFALKSGIIVADTKLEFGLLGKSLILILIDEALTPDSSRFWPLEGYQPGRTQPSFDKQPVRDYLVSIGWDKKPPAPELPSEIIKQTSQRYLEAYRRLTGREMIEEPQTIVKSRKTPQDELSDPASDPSLAGVVIVGPFLSNPHTESSERFEGKGGEFGGAGAQGSFETTASEESHGSAPEETDHDDGRDSGGDTGESDDE